MCVCARAVMPKNKNNNARVCECSNGPNHPPKKCIFPYGVYVFDLKMNGFSVHICIRH